MNIKDNQICETPETVQEFHTCALEHAGYSHAKQIGMLQSYNVSCVRYTQLP